MSNELKKPLITVKRAGKAYSATIVRNPTYNLSQHKRQKGNQYLDKNGNRADYNVSETKKVENVRKTLKKAKQILTGNFNAKMRDDFITLTYATDTTDYKQVKRDFNLFIDRLQYEYSADNPKNRGRAKHKHSFEFEYVKIMDVSAKGNLHIHLLLKDRNGKPLRLNPATIERLWGHGMVKQKKIYDIKGLANYLCELYVTTKDGRKRKDRVPLYPKGMRLYSVSKNIENIEKVENTDSETEIKNKTLENNGIITANDIFSSDGDLLNTVTKCEWVQEDLKVTSDEYIKAIAEELRQEQEIEKKLRIEYWEKLGIDYPDILTAKNGIFSIKRHITEMYHEVRHSGLSKFNKAKCYYEIKAIREEIKAKCYYNEYEPGFADDYIVGINLKNIIHRLYEMKVMLTEKRVEMEREHREFIERIKTEGSPEEWTEEDWNYIPEDILDDTRDTVESFGEIPPDVRRTDVRDEDIFIETPEEKATTQQYDMKDEDIFQ